MASAFCIQLRGRVQEYRLADSAPCIRKKIRIASSWRFKALQNNPRCTQVQALATSDMVSSMAVGTQLATLQGENIVSKLHYANNQVDFNGQKMTVEEFVGFVMSKLGSQEVEQ